MVVTPPPGHTRRFFTTVRHFSGLLAGGLVAYADRRRLDGTGLGPRFLIVRAAAGAVRPFVRRDLAGQPFAVQLRRRLELLGPTYIKLGQILSLREDILPIEVTDELKGLLSRLPAAPIEVIEEIIERDLGRSVDAAFAWIDPEPLGCPTQRFDDGGIRTAELHRLIARDRARVGHLEIEVTLRNERRAAALADERMAEAELSREVFELGARSVGAHHQRDAVPRQTPQDPPPLGPTLTPSRRSGGHQLQTRPPQSELAA